MHCSEPGAGDYFLGLFHCFWDKLEQEKVEHSHISSLLQCWSIPPSKFYSWICSLALRCFVFCVWHENWLVHHSS